MKALNIAFFVFGVASLQTSSDYFFEGVVLFTDDCGTSPGLGRLWTGRRDSGQSKAKVS